MDPLHWCFHCPSSTNWVASLSPPPYPPTPLSPPSPTFPPPVPNQSLLPDMSCDSILFAELTDEETNMKVAVSVHVYSDMTAELVFDEMPHCISKVFAAPQRKQRPDTLEFEHSTIDATLSVESAKFKDTSTELNSDLDNKTAEAGFVTATLYSQPLVIVTGDTKSEFERHEALSTGFIFPDLEKIGVVSSMFDEMPDSRVVYRYRLTSEYVAAPHMLLHFPFDPGSAVRLVIDRGATEACVGHTAICLSSVEGKFWVSESGQKSDMESGCKLFKTKPEKDNFAAFCGPNRGCIILLEVGSLFTLNRPYWSYSINLPLVVHDMQFYWKVPTQANCDIADAFIHEDFSFVATIEGLLNLVTILVTISDLKASS